MIRIPSNYGFNSRFSQQWRNDHFGTYFWQELALQLQYCNLYLSLWRTCVLDVVRVGHVVGGYACVVLLFHPLSAWQGSGFNLWIWTESTIWLVSGSLLIRPLDVEYLLACWLAGHDFGWWNSVLDVLKVNFGIISSDPENLEWHLFTRLFPSLIKWNTKWKRKVFFVCF